MPVVMAAVVVSPFIPFGFSAFSFPPVFVSFPTVAPFFSFPVFGIIAGTVKDRLQDISDSSGGVVCRCPSGCHAEGKND